jgi:phytoene dehydrogenase-like protein
MKPTNYDAVVVGAGPNGLAAAIELARAGLDVCVLEAGAEIGGGARSAELTQPGFLHDTCSAIHPMGAVSPFFRSLPLERWGLEWIYSPVALAHPFDDGTAATLLPSLEQTADALGPDGAAYRRLMSPLVAGAETLFREVLKPLRLSKHPLLIGRFGLVALQSCHRLIKLHFSGEQARALVAGCGAHSAVPLERAGTSAIGLILMLAAHTAGWPCALGGSRQITAALGAYLQHLGGEIRIDSPVRSMDDLPRAHVVLFDLTPRQVLQIVGDRLSARFRRRLDRFRYGPGVFKIDWALDGPIPWKSDACRRSATVHVGGTSAEIAAAEAAVWRGEHPERPFVLVAQQSLFDSTRAPSGKHTGWGYCHVPHDSAVDMNQRIELQIERFAPGFRDRIIARHTRTAQAMQAHNANFIGGDIGGGANDLWQTIARPVLALDPYATGDEQIFLCSSSTPPGGGVHGMCGYWAARSVLRRHSRKTGK